jgi:hypothetical protein
MHPALLRNDPGAQNRIASVSDQITMSYRISIGIRQIGG